MKFLEENRNVKKNLEDFLVEGLKPIEVKESVNYRIEKIANTYKKRLKKYENDKNIFLITITGMGHVPSLGKVSLENGFVNYYCIPLFKENDVYWFYNECLKSQALNKKKNSQGNNKFNLIIGDNHFSEYDISCVLPSINDLKDNNIKKIITFAEFIWPSLAEKGINALVADVIFKGVTVDGNAEKPIFNASKIIIPYSQLKRYLKECIKNGFSVILEGLEE